MLYHYLNLLKFMVIYMSIICSCLLFSCLGSLATISTNLNSVPVLNGTNFKDWKENILIVLGCIDLDLVIREDQPASLTENNTHYESRLYEK